MDNKKPVKSGKSRLKTLCTIDTSDIDLSDFKHADHLQTKNTRSQSRKNKPLTHKSKEIKYFEYSVKFPKGNQPIDVGACRVWSKTPAYKRTINVKDDLIGASFNRSCNSAIKNEQPKSKYKKIAIRHKTQYEPYENIKSSRKKVTYNMDRLYDIQSFKIVNKILQTKVQRVLLGQCTKTHKLFIIKKTKNQDRIEQYQKQIEFKPFLARLPQNMRKYFCKLSYIERFPHQLTLVYFNYGKSLSFQNSSHLQLMKKSTKNNLQILKYIIAQVAKAIQALSQIDVVHGAIKIQNIFFRLEEKQETIKMQKIVKVGNFFKSFSARNMKKILQLDKSVYTPPQVINLMMFQQKLEDFDRDLLQCMTNYEKPCKIDVWGLGIFILQILTGIPVPDYENSLPSIFKYQLEIRTNFAYYLKQIQAQTSFFNLWIKMLDPNPNQRPLPFDIINILS